MTGLDVHEDEAVFRTEVLVEGRLGDLRRADQSVDADRADALCVEEVVSRLKDADLRARSTLCGRIKLDVI